MEIWNQNNARDNLDNVEKTSRRWLTTSNNSCMQTTKSLNAHTWRNKMRKNANKRLNRNQLSLNLKLNKSRLRLKRKRCQFQPQLNNRKKLKKRKKNQRRLKKSAANRIFSLKLPITSARSWIKTSEKPTDLSQTTQEWQSRKSSWNTLNNDDYYYHYLLLNSLFNLSIT